MKATAIAHPNIALTKYWGNRYHLLNIPYNNSISMNLSTCITKTTVEFSNDYKKDVIYIDDKLIEQNPESKKNPYSFITKIREDFMETDSYAKIVSKNNFPQGSGIASSASGAAALTLAATKAAGLDLNEADLSRLARLYSGSGCRSIPTGFVEWDAGNTHENSYAKSIAPPNHWDIADIVAIVSTEHKQYGSTTGHEMAETSPMLDARIEAVREHNKHIKYAILNKDFKTLGRYAEKDAMNLHGVMITSDLSEKLNTTDISMLYWGPETVQVINLVKYMRTKNIQAYFTIDAGPNVHILTTAEDLPKVKNNLEILRSTGVVKGWIINNPGEGAKSIDDHLF